MKLKSSDNIFQTCCFIIWLYKSCRKLFSGNSDNYQVMWCFHNFNHIIFFQNTPCPKFSGNFAQKSVTWKVWPLVWGRGMAELTDLTTTYLYEKKFCSIKCDMKSVTSCYGRRYGWVDKPNHHYSIWTKILLKKVQHRKCDPLGPVDRPDFHNYILIEILLKKVRLRKCDPLGPINWPDFQNYILIEILLKKVLLRKCDPLGPMDRPDFHNYVLIEILLKKVRLRKCDPLGPIDRPDFHNYILIQILLKKVRH